MKNTIKVMEEPELLVIGVNRFNKNTGNKKSQKVSLSLIIDQDFMRKAIAGIIEHVGAENKNFCGYRSLVNIENK